MSRRIYRKIYEEHHGIKIPKFMEIHHIDGNHDNNNIANLKLVTLQEHYDIHYSQGDYGACWLMLKRLKVSNEERKKISTLSASKANKEGKCGFSLGHASKAGKIGGKKGGVYAKENRTGIFAMTQEQVLAKNRNTALTKLVNSGKACRYPKERI
jgi:hypothetical protein